MGIIERLIGGAAAAPIEAIGNVLDKVFTSDDEKLDKKVLLAKIAQKPQILQAEINKIEASHRSIFVAGWRPAIGWVCVIGLAFATIVSPVMSWLATKPVPQVPPQLILDLIFALLGLGGLRTIEKLKRRDKP